MTNEKEQFYMSLQPSEMAVFRAAATIFAGYITSGRVTDENENEMMRKSIKVAIKMANTIDKAIASDDEMTAGF